MTKKKKNNKSKLEYENALYWFLIGFKLAETTPSQEVSLSQTMKDAKTFFPFVWDKHKGGK